MTRAEPYARKALNESSTIFRESITRSSPTYVRGHAHVSINPAVSRIARYYLNNSFFPFISIYLRRARRETPAQAIPENTTRRTRTPPIYRPRRG